MANAPGQQTAAIEADLLENGDEYDLIQAMRLLERVCDASRTGDAATQLRVRPELSLDFPAGEVTDISRDGEDGAFNIRTTRYGLYGVSSPLPAYLTEDLMDDQWDEEEAPRAFLDIVHYHLYPLFYAAWAKHQLGYNTIEKGHDENWDFFCALFGLGGTEFQTGFPERHRIIKYAGILTQQPKSAMGLETILRDVLQDPGVNVSLCERDLHRIPEDQQMRLGERNCELGEDGVIGKVIADRSGKIAIHIGPISYDELLALKHDENRLGFVNRLIGFYLVQPLKCDLVVTLEQGTVGTTALGEPGRSRLGEETWIRDGVNQQRERVVIPLRA